jgi:hypothetical protein
VRKQEYTITNIFKIDKYRSILENDIIEFLNQKNIICFSTSSKIKVETEINIDENIFIDGFDISFDLIHMK